MPTDWYEVVEDSSLETGDIILNCAIYLPVLKENPDEPATEMEVVNFDLIVLSQSCDLVIDREKLDQVVLCPIRRRSEIEGDPDSPLHNKGALSNAAKNKEPAFFVLQECDHEELKFELTVVHFRQVYTLPLTSLRKIAEARGKRLRLRSPYKEALASRFASYFARIGLPEDIRL